MPSDLGVYFAKDGNTSFGSYAQGGATWKNSQLYPQSCAALTEIVNLPDKFVSNNPHYVVADTTWIVWYAPLGHGVRRLDSHFLQSLSAREQQEQRDSIRPQQHDDRDTGFQ